MVFPSVPVYLHHSSWLQQQAGDSVIQNLQLTTVPPSPSPALARGDGGTTEIIRPCSMPERARLAKLPYQETPLKCPRCESTNTKFCYFNNYSLSQPRHFCKTCRRYWTRGGALRDVPVGGGCRRSRSKKSKGSQSKSPVTSTISTTPIYSNNIPIFPSLPNVPDVVGNELRLPIDIPSPTTTGTLTFPAAFSDQWMMSTSYNIEREAINPLIYDVQAGFEQLSSSVLKQEENQGSLSRNYPGNYDQYWSANTWKDLSATHFM